MKRIHPDSGISREDFDKLGSDSQEGLVDLYKRRAALDKAIRDFENLEIGEKNSKDKEDKKNT